MSQNPISGLSEINLQQISYVSTLYDLLYIYIAHLCSALSRISPSAASVEKLDVRTLGYSRLVFHRSQGWPNIRGVAAIFFGANGYYS
jgi:hypothetical protein